MGELELLGLVRARLRGWPRNDAGEGRADPGCAEHFAEPSPSAGPVGKRTPRQARAARSNILRDHGIAETRGPRN